MTSLTKLRIQAIIEANLYSAHAYWEAAQIVDDQQLQMQLRSWARERTHQAKQLRRLLSNFSSTATDGDEIQDWLSDLTESSFTPILQEAESPKLLFQEAVGNESCLKKMYEKLLADPDVLPLRKELDQHYAQIRAISFNVERLCS